MCMIPFVSIGRMEIGVIMRNDRCTTIGWVGLGMQALGFGWMVTGFDFPL